MTALTADLKRLTEAAEKKAEGKDPFRQKIHLMPPVGWLNDPNGLCQFQGIYHGFFQYSPFNPEGGVKMWGHYTSSNMIDWEYQGVPLYPDQPFDCSGVYSGAAFIEDGEMFLYYTGNVKLEDGEYDYINTGRQANTVLVSSRDGIHFSRKKKLMDNRDYPSDLTLHVRDPKVWKKEDTYYMILGARTKKDEGQVLLYQSEDRIHWSLANRIKTEHPFGYMWECPDYLRSETGRSFPLLSRDWKETGGKTGMYTSPGISFWMVKFPEIIIWENTGFGIMDLITTPLRASRQKMAGSSRSAGWECRIVKNTLTGLLKMAGSTALLFPEKSI